jgi:hypothetical protein
MLRAGNQRRAIILERQVAIADAVLGFQNPAAGKVDHLRLDQPFRERLQ